jgi:hypothetical protein
MGQIVMKEQHVASDDGGRLEPIDQLRRRGKAEILWVAIPKHHGLAGAYDAEELGQGQLPMRRAKQPRVAIGNLNQSSLSLTDLVLEFTSRSLDRHSMQVAMVPQRVTFAENSYNDFGGGLNALAHHKKRRSHGVFL